MNTNDLPHGEPDSDSPDTARTPAGGSRLPRTAPGLLLALAVAVMALVVNLFVPIASALLVAILTGVALTNIAPLPASTAPGLAVAAKKLLRVGIVLLGLQVSLLDIGELGAGMILVVLAVVVGGLLITEYAGRALRIAPAQRSLIGAGFSICGAAAVAGVEGVIDDKKDEDVVTALALVVLFGTLMIPLVPLLSAVLGLEQQVAGLWAGGSIHEVAQVVAAAGIIGGAALKAAVVVKLARVLMLAPVAIWFGWQTRRRRDGASGSDDTTLPPLVPLFVLGFLVAVAIRTTGVVPTALLDGLKYLQTVLLAAAMFALGCGVRIATLKTVGGRPFALATVTTIGVAVIALAGVLLTC